MNWVLFDQLLFGTRFRLIPGGMIYWRIGELRYEHLGHFFKADPAMAVLLVEEGEE